MFYSVCTGNYWDGYDFVIESWLKTGVSRVVIFTDDPDRSHSDERVEFVKAFSHSTNWSENAARKAYATELAMKFTDYDHIAYLDIDCYLTGDVGHVFDADFELALTRIERQYASNGVFFMKRCDRVDAFVERYVAEQRKLPLMRPKEKTWDYDQKAFTIAFKSVPGFQVENISFSKYNRKISSTVRTAEQKKQLAEDQPFVLHFYNNSYRDKDNVKEVFEVLGL